jgi:hypothetical protein
MTRTRRPGFTLFQLLLILALLALLLGLLLPAIQRARLLAARTRCGNNLRQICLATINCADTHGSLMPPVLGPYPNMDHTLAGNGDGTLFFHILPYLEQDNLYKSASDGKTYAAWNNGTYARVMPTYLCPNDPTGGSSHLHDGWLATSSYAANFLVFGNTQDRSLTGRGKFPASITDGTSNTIFFTERYQECHGDPCAWGYFGASTWAPAFAYLNGGKFQAAPSEARCDPTLPQGAHVGGITVGMGDGSARFVSSEISPQTWWHACTPSGGEVLGDDW